MTNTDIRPAAATTLPSWARLPINRCNVPPDVLGSLHFQAHPMPIRLDGVETLHGDLFDALDDLAAPSDRARRFMDYMTVHFRLEALEDAGYDPGNDRARPRADYLRILRGWMFDADGREAAILKSWVESRFGLLARHHKGALKDFSSPTYEAYQADRARGLYNTNALEAQLDLLYSYCQYELARRRPDDEVLVLYRGVNRFDDFELLAEGGSRRPTLLLNNINSFTDSRVRADEFGDRVLKVRVPAAKVFYYSGLLPNRLRGEGEYIVIGGAYTVESLAPSL
jgi:NAD+--dinitrogen-reductase ADP-D-ribosyltransferase